LGGSVPLDGGHLIMAWVVARQLQPESAPEQFGAALRALRTELQPGTLN
jgi:hypothetical protein